MERHILLFGSRSRLVRLIGLLILCASGADAHLLNMTLCTVSLDTKTSQVTVDLKIDFTRILGDPVAYYEVTRMAPKKSVSERTHLIKTIQDGLWVRSGEEPLLLKNTAFNFPDLPLAKFTEPWAAPMSELSFKAELPTGATELFVVSKPSLLIEYPLVVSLSQGEGFSTTRWLEPGQKSPVLVIAGGDSSVDEVEATSTMNSDSIGADALRYTVLGFQHILPKGLDHILFVVGLFFLVARWRPLLLQVSFFTLAHTLTLMLVALDIIPYWPAVVEPLIALSIAYVGIENLRKTQINRFRLLVVFLFGLVHGMGFASMLGTLDLPAGEIFAAIVAFNFGVELGQLTLIAFLAVVCFKLFGWKHYQATIRNPVNVSISLIASVWFVQRIMF